MKKIKCDICGKDINYYDQEINEVDSYDYGTLDICDDCLDAYWEVRNRCGDKYNELWDKYYKKLIKEMRKYYADEIEKIKR